jgi:hypothetical protein
MGVPPECYRGTAVGVAGAQAAFEILALPLPPSRNVSRAEGFDHLLRVGADLRLNVWQT